MLSLFSHRRRRSGGKQAAYKAGLRAESFVCLLLTLSGWRVAARRLQTPCGEIDIVACRRNIVLVAEVKYREKGRTGTPVPPSECLSSRQQERLERASLFALQRYGSKSSSLRRDVFIIEGKRLTRLKNAF